MFDIAQSSIDGCVELTATVRADARGQFVKTVHADFFHQHGLRADFTEQYYSVSHRGVVRGLHFQTPPCDHAKLVYCIEGEVFDAVVDLRAGSPTFGHHCTFVLSAKKANQIYIPTGLAHGFCVTSERAMLVYNVTSVFAPEHDGGIAWDSAGIEWPVETAEVSERDKSFAALANFKTPFSLT